MLVSFEKRFIFVANTKTASTSIERALMPYSDICRVGTPARKHVSLFDAVKIYSMIFGQKGFEHWRFFRFGVMREPKDWIASWYRYRKGNQVESPLPADMSFAEFWRARDWNIQNSGGAPKLQRDMFCGPHGKAIVDVIIPYHKIEPMFAEICEAMWIPAPLPRKNVSNVRDDNVIPVDLEDELRQHYAKDYELWEQLDAINEKGMAKLAARRSNRKKTS